MALLKEGVRDGAVARAAHDYLHVYRGGQVSATLDIISVDLVSQTVVLTRNSHSPALLDDAETIHMLASQAGAIGPHRHTRPDIRQWPLVAGLRLVVVTDGILAAGGRAGRRFDPLPCFAGSSELPAPALADRLLAAALAADDGRPNDDMTVVALTTHRAAPAPAPLIRRLAATLPLDSLVPPRP